MLRTSSPRLLYLCWKYNAGVNMNIIQKFKGQHPFQRLTTNLYLNFIPPGPYVSPYTAVKHRYIRFCHIVNNQCCWTTATDVEMLSEVFCRFYRNYSWRCFLANLDSIYCEFHALKYFTRESEVPCQMCLKRTVYYLLDRSSNCPVACLQRTTLWRRKSPCDRSIWNK